MSTSSWGCPSYGHGPTGSPAGLSKSVDLKLVSLLSSLGGGGDGGMIQKVAIGLVSPIGRIICQRHISVSPLLHRAGCRISVFPVSTSISLDLRYISGQPADEPFFGIVCRGSAMIMLKDFWCSSYCQTTRERPALAGTRTSTFPDPTLWRQSSHREMVG